MYVYHYLYLKLGTVFGSELYPDTMDDRTQTDSETNQVIYVVTTTEQQMVPDTEQQTVLLSEHQIVPQSGQKMVAKPEQQKVPETEQLMVSEARQQIALQTDRQMTRERTDKYTGQISLAPLSLAY